MNKMLHTLSLPTALVIAMTMSQTGCHSSKTPEAAPAQDPWPAMPEPGPAPSFEVPAATEFQLDNGIPVTLIANPKVPLTHIQMNFNWGRLSEKPEQRGLAALTSHMLSEGTTTRSALELSAALQTLASRVSFRSNLEYAALSIETLDDKLEDTLTLAADMLVNPAFNPSDIERVKRNIQNAILTERDDLNRTADKVFRKVLFGDQYLGTWSRGTNTTVQSITRDDLVWWHRTQWRLGNSALIVVSGLSKDVILANLNKAFGSPIDKPKAIPVIMPPKPQPAHGSKTIYWVQKDGASQSVLMLGNVAPAFDPAHSTAQQAGNSVLGGQFTSRVNMNLREDKGYTYGARTSVSTHRFGGYYRASASVKANTTAASLTEFLKELNGIIDTQPITETEYKNTCSRMLQGWPAYFERGQGMLRQYAAANAHRRPKGWLQGYEGRVNALNQETVQKAITDLIDPSKLAIVVVGDWAIAGKEVEALNLGPIVHLDHDGNPATAKPEN